MKKAAKITYIFHWVFMGLIFAMSIVGAFINKDASVKSIYVFNATQSFLFLIVSFTPTILKKLQFEIPDVVYIVFVVFMSAHFFLGEICGFFAKVSWWDSLLHSFSGFILTFISFSVISLMNESKNKNFKLNIWFSILFAFSLTVAIGVVWEIIEFASDALLGTNMQRAYVSIADGGARGEALVGTAALLDTMKDLMLDAAGSICACLLCLFLYKTKNIDLGNNGFIKRKKANIDEANNVQESVLTAEEEGDKNLMLDEKTEKQAKDKKKKKSKNAK